MIRFRGPASAVRLAVAGVMTLAALPVVAQVPAVPIPEGAPPPEVIEQIVQAEIVLGGDEWRVPKFALSPRRHENMTITLADKQLYGFVAYPDKSDKASVVLMIPEDQGLNNWARDMADQIAAMGYIVVVPDMLSGLGPNRGGRDSFADIRDVFRWHSVLTRQQPALTAQLNAWADWGKGLPQSNGTLGVVGFAWGGGRAAWLATARNDLSGVFIFYDWVPPAAPVEAITAPVYGFYAEIDPRVTRSLESTKARMAAAGKTYEPVTYPGSDHMFVRLGDEPGNRNPANILARNAALARLQELLARM